MASRLLYNAATWIPPSDAAIPVLNRVWVSVFRSIAHAHFCEATVTDDAVLRATRTPLVRSIISVARLRYLPRVMAHAPDVLSALLQEAVRLGSP